MLKTMQPARSLPAPMGAFFPMRRAAFVQHLRQRLADHRIVLVTAELAHNGAQSVWFLSFQLPNQHVAAVHAPIDPAFDPLAIEVADDVAVRVLRTFPWIP